MAVGADAQITDLTAADHACLTFGEPDELSDLTAAFVRDTNVDYRQSVANIGETVAGQPITVTDVLPAGLSFVSATGSGWACGALSQAVTSSVRSFRCCRAKAWG